MNLRSVIHRAVGRSEPQSSSRKLPCGTCGACGRKVAGRYVDGQLILRPHNRANAGTRASNYGVAVLCNGSGRPATESGV